MTSILILYPHYSDVHMYCNIVSSVRLYSPSIEIYISLMYEVWKTLFVEYLMSVHLEELKAAFSPLSLGGGKKKTDYFGSDPLEL